MTRKKRCSFQRAVHRSKRIASTKIVTQNVTLNYVSIVTPTVKKDGFSFSSLLNLLATVIRFFTCF